MMVTLISIKIVSFLTNGFFQTIMERIITADGSVTFRSPDVGECYHTHSGAVEESFEKHAKPARVDELAKKQDKIVIFDVCFGLGYNSAAAIDMIKHVNKDCEIIVYGFENDQTILDAILEVEPKFESFDLIKKVVKTHYLNENNVTIHILLGDAKEKIKTVAENADVVFFDPFSPKKAPHMWEYEFLKDIYNKMNTGAILTTYSCARVVRDNLKAAGFEVKDGPIIGRRSPSTIAIKV